MSQQYLVPCECGKTVSVTTSQAGRIIQCSCGRDVKVPTLSGLRQLAPPAKDDLPFPKATAAPVWSPAKGAMFVIGVMLTILGLIVGGYNSYIVRQIDTEDYSTKVQEKVEENIDTLDATQIVDLFEYVKAEGIGDAGSATHLIMRKISGSFLTSATVGFGIALLGLVLAGASLVNTAAKK